jgi:hypothetical protein
MPKVHSTLVLPIGMQAHPLHFVHFLIQARYSITLKHLRYGSQLRFAKTNHLTHSTGVNDHQCTSRLVDCTEPRPELELRNTSRTFSATVSRVSTNTTLDNLHQFAGSIDLLVRKFVDLDSLTPRNLGMGGMHLEHRTLDLAGFLSRLTKSGIRMGMPLPL